MTHDTPATPIVTICRILSAYLCLPSIVRLASPQRCSPTRNGRFARPCNHSAYTYTPSGRSPARLVGIYAVGSQSCATRLIFVGSAPLSAYPPSEASRRRRCPCRGAKQAAQCILGNWANGTCARHSLRGKARLLPRAASTVRSAILRRRDTASSSRARPVAHHANRSLAVPLRLLLTHAPLARPSSMARFFS